MGRPTTRPSVEEAGEDLDATSMRRTLILALLVLVLAGAGGTLPAGESSRARAAEGDPDDFCSHSPDFPFGWSFNEACRGHDECLLDLPDTALLPDRLGCDDSFFDDLLESTHLRIEGACAESRICRVLASLYYQVVRFVSMVALGGVEPAVLPAVPPSSG